VLLQPIDFNAFEQILRKYSQRIKKQQCGDPHQNFKYLNQLLPHPHHLALFTINILAPNDL
jgi:hypothetical protein